MSEWLVNIKQALDENSSASDVDQQQLESKPFITRVATPLHIARPSAFTPQTLAIGPFHRTLIKEGQYAFSFAEMESFKLAAARALFTVPMSTAIRDDDVVSHAAGEVAGGPGFSITRLAEQIMKDCKSVRASFDTALGMGDYGDEEMGYMLALDSVFIVAILHSLYNDVRATDDVGTSRFVPCSFSPVYQRRLSYPIRKAMILDMLLLENQVPLVYVKMVMQMMEGKFSNGVESRFEELMDALADHALPFCKGVRGVGHANAKHLLGCMYNIATYKVEENEEQNGFQIMDPLLQRIDSKAPRVQPQVALVPTASGLHRAGVDFKGHPLSLSHASFDGNTLTLPIIHVGDETERIFRNLLAYESLLEDAADVVSYLHFMNSLINTEDDVALLVEAGVISEDIGDYQHVARLWNELATNSVCVFTPRYSWVAAKARSYVDKEIHGILAELKERYFSRPWLVLSLLSGTALLVMTFVIMHYTILLYRLG